MTLLEQLETELGLSTSDALKVLYFIQERDIRVLENITDNLKTI